jgi:hypothetical protein
MCLREGKVLGEPSTQQSIVTRFKVEEQISQRIRDTRGLGSNASHLKERSNTGAV